MNADVHKHMSNKAKHEPSEGVIRGDAIDVLIGKKMKHKRFNRDDS